MVDLKKKPFFLSDEQIRWVESTISAMTLEEKIGQLFVNMVTDRSEESLQSVVDTYHPGAIRYQNASAEVIYEQNRILQQVSKVPLLIASNCEMGGNGGVEGGTPMANGAAIAASGNNEAAYETAKVGAAEARAVGCNWNFAPVVDLTYNWRNTIVQTRTFKDDPYDTIRYSKRFFRGTKTQNIATCIKHFPGDGTEENDQHLIMGINEMSCKEWDETFGKVYKELIDEGVMTIMAGHIALPAYSRKLRPEIKDKDIRPATLAPELITDLLKGQLGFNGLVVTDASHMIGMFGASVPRSEQGPGAIAAGCDMFLFFNNREEDFSYMMEGYKKGVITEERLNDALYRILGIKAALNLHKQKEEQTLMPTKEGLSIIGCKEHREAAALLAEQYVTLVKDREGYLPMTKERYKRLKLVFVGGEDFVVAGKLIKNNNDAVKKDIINQLEKEGFEINADDMIEKGKVEDFKKQYDAVLLILNVSGFAQYNTMRVKWAIPTQQPWYISELPTIVWSATFPNMLIDVPMAKCYINSYMNSTEAINATIEKMMGKSKFKGKYNDNVFCERWETRI